MKLLLTSAGFANQSIVSALLELTGRPFAELTLVYVPTAANVEEGDKEWLIDDYANTKKMGFKELDIVDVAAVPRDVWQPRLEKADVILVGGGNTSYLMSQMRKTGVAALLATLLRTRVYVGISAGSMVLAPQLAEKEMQRLYEEPIVGDDTNRGLGLVDFLVVPHMNSPHFPRVAELVDEVAEDLAVPFYGIDDQTAIKVIDNDVTVVGEGEWKAFNV